MKLLKEDVAPVNEGSKQLAEICSKYGYALNYAVNKQYKKGGKLYPMIAISSVGDREFKPWIYFEDNAFGRDGRRFTAQTTSYGALGLNDYEEFASNVNKAYKLLKELEEFDLNKLPVVTDFE